MIWTKKKKVMASLVTVAVLGSVAAFGVFGAFSAETSNDGNEFSAGTVAISDNDAGGFLYQVTNAAPGQSNPANEACINVEYTGTSAAGVHLFTPTSALASAALSPYVNLEITKGTQASPSFKTCTGFTPATTAGDVYDGTLQTFGTDYTDYASGIALTNPSGATSWANGDAVVYRFRATLSASAPNSAQGASTGTHSFTWGAQSVAP
ncbi:MAG: hypothetical protein J0H98_05740 [Solirubrobacterales bacterium]|nr:hypothetical protein [Solirubrobacterales bacterium]